MRESLEQKSGADRDMMQQGMVDLQIQLDQLRLEKHNLQVTANEDKKKLTDALEQTELQLKKSEDQAQVRVIKMCTV